MTLFGIDTLILKNIPAVNRLSDQLTSTALASTITRDYLLPFGTWMAEDPWRCYGIGPVVAVFLGLIFNTIWLEWLTAQPFMQKYLVTYSKSESRADAVKKTQKKVSWRDQFLDSLWQVGGPMNVIGCVFMRYALEYLQGGLPATPLPPTLLGFMIDFWLLAMIADFFLYWGHRIQHENKYLWDNCHSVHHRLLSPTASSTAYIEPRDAMLQSAIPLLMSAFIVRPHFITHLCYLFHHLQNNALNHSGIAPNIILDVLTLKMLPLRSGSVFHDCHHRFSSGGAGGSGKNYAEWTWVWDYIFGTYSTSHEVAVRKL